LSAPYWRHGAILALKDPQRSKQGTSTGIDISLVIMGRGEGGGDLTMGIRNSDAYFVSHKTQVLDFFLYTIQIIVLKYF
jgi:hypothetical protein